MAECALSDVVEEAQRLARMAAENPLVKDVLLTDAIHADAVSDMPGNGKGPGKGEREKRRAGGAARVLGIGLAAGELAAAGVVGLEGERKGERNGRVRLGVGDEEVRLALRDDGEVKGLGFGG